MVEQHESIYLREITGSDIPLINEWRRDRDIVDLLGGAFRYSNVESDTEWFAAYCRARDRNVRLGIVLRESNELIGVAYLLGIDWTARSAELGLFIGSKVHQGKGFGSAAEQMTLLHAFSDLNLHRVYCTALADNGRALHVHEKSGFVREGEMREAVYKNGAYRNLVLFGIVREDYTRLDG